MTNKTTKIQDAFEDALIEGLMGSPVVSKEGEVLMEDGKVVRQAPDSAFLSVCRAYLKDIKPPADPKDTREPLVSPKAAGPAKGALAEFQARAAAMPFGAKALN